MESMYVMHCTHCDSVMYEFMMDTFNKCKNCVQWENGTCELERIIDNGWEHLNHDPQCMGLKEEIENIERFYNSIQSDYTNSLTSISTQCPVYKLKEYIPYLKARMERIINGEYDKIPLFYST